MSDMYIEALHVKNVRLFSEVNIQFNRRFNFLAGPNGCGKTSVLACISHCYTNKGDFEYSRYGKDAEFWSDIVQGDKKYRVGVDHDSLSTNRYRKTDHKGLKIPPSVEGSKSLNPFMFTDLLQANVLFLGAQRDIKYKEIPGVSKERSTEEATKEYFSNGTKSLYGEWQTDIKQWIVNRYFMIDKAWALDRKQNWEHFLNNLSKIAPFNSNFQFVDVREDCEPKFSLYDKECYLEELSAGYQGILSIIISIIAWLENTREGDDCFIQKATGTVCIDEPDVHLHPEWQLTLREGLSNLFPNLQFIVTTHSPHLLASADAGEVIIMPSAYTEPVYNLTPREKSFSGWETDDILREIMGVVSLDNRERAKLIRQAYNAIDSKNVIILKDTIETLKQICHPNDTIVTELTLELASLQALQGSAEHD